MWPCFRGSAHEEIARREKLASKMERAIETLEAQAVKARMEPGV